MQKTVLGLFIALGLHADAHAQDIVLRGYFTSSAAWSLYNNGGDGVQAIMDPANWPAFGITGVTRLPGVNHVTAADLAGVDVFFTGLKSGSFTFDPGEVRALVDFVDDGGVLFVNNDRSACCSFIAIDPLLNAFGLDLVDASTPLETLVLDVPMHPLLDGPFGTVQNLVLADASRVTTTDPRPDVLVSWPNGDGAVAVVEPEGTRLGTVIFLPDIENFFHSFHQIQDESDIAFKNAFAFAAHSAGLGVRYCSPANPNSTGLPGRIAAVGSSLVSANDLMLVAEQLPPGEFGYFLVGSNQGAFQPPGSAGVICLACGFQGCSGIGRFNQIGNIIQGPTGSIAVDLAALPLSPPAAVQPGETWNFQCWYRDLGTNNFTDAVSVRFM